jgi:hypothetical protein
MTDFKQAPQAPVGPPGIPRRPGAPAIRQPENKTQQARIVAITIIDTRLFERANNLRIGTGGKLLSDATIGNYLLYYHYYCF